VLPWFPPTGLVTVGFPKTTGTVVASGTITNVDPELIVVLPVSPGKLELTGTIIDPGITTSNVPDITVVLPGSD